MLNEHSPAPLDINVCNHNNETLTLRQHLGKKIILYFYPKDDTPGCTKQACGLRDDWADFADLDLVVYGVSPDTAEKHQKFIAKYALPFPLLCDTEHQLAEAFGCWGEKKMYGKTYMGIFRSTFVIDEQGNIAKVFANVKPAEHAQQLLNYLNSVAS